MSVIETMSVKLTGDTSDYESKMSKAAGTFSGLGEKMMSGGKKLTAGVTLPLIGLGVASVASATKFSASMANVQTLLTDTADGGAARTAELADAVQAMSVEIGKSTDDLADGLYQTISAFGDTADTIQILEINARAATAGLATTEQAIGLTSAVTKGYGDTSAEAVQKVSDLAFQAVKLGQTTFPELAGSMGKVTPLAASMNVSMEEMFGVMATATGVTGGAAEVSTQLRGVLQSLMAPTGEMTELIASMGYASGAAMIEGEGLQGAINAIVGAAEESGTPLQKYMGSIEGQTLAMALAGPQADSFTEKLTAMGTSAGAADAAFVAQSEGVNALGFQWEQAKAQMTVITQQMGEALVPALLAAMEAAQPLIAGIASMAAGFATLNPQTQTLILGAIGLAAALGPVMMGVSMIMPLISGLGVVLGVVLSPIGLVVAAVAGLAAVLFDVGGAGTFAREKLEEWGLEGLATALGTAQAAAASLVETVKGLVSGEISFGDLLPPGWINDLMFWKWPELGVPSWIETLFNWTWPVLGPVAWVIKLMGWAWPKLTKPNWLQGLLDFSWPSFPDIPGWLGGGGEEAGANADGTSNWRGGLSWVGEEGPELVNLPRGAQVFPADVSASMAGAGAGVTINNYNTINTEIDEYKLTRKIVENIRRGGV